MYIIEVRSCRGIARFYGPFEYRFEAVSVLASKRYMLYGDRLWRRGMSQAVARIIPILSRYLLTPKTDTSPLPWQKCHRSYWGGYEVIHNGIYFWYGGRRYGQVVANFQGPDEAGINLPVTGSNSDRHAAVREYVPTKRTQTRFVNWAPCALGHCRRLTLQINGKKYWAEYSEVLDRFLVFGKHGSKRSLGSLPVSFVPIELVKEVKTKKSSRKKRKRNS